MPLLLAALELFNYSPAWNILGKYHCSMYLYTVQISYWITRHAWKRQQWTVYMTKLINQRALFVHDLVNRFL